MTDALAMHRATGHSPAGDLNLVSVLGCGTGLTVDTASSLQGREFDVVIVAARAGIPELLDAHVHGSYPQRPVHPHIGP